MTSKPNKGKIDNHNLQNGGLFIVSTPIGNLNDMTFRAVETLKSVDFIACEDTRNTKKLLNHFGISAKCIQYHDYSKQSDRDKIIDLIKGGSNIALVSDAGTPLISDPGYKLVCDAREMGISVTPIPGVSSITCALSVCGLPTDKFIFIGFLPHETMSSKNILDNLRTVDATIVALESPGRLIKTLNSIIETLGDRRVSIARELTKMHEEVITDCASEIINYYSKNTLKGELVLLIEGAKEANASENDIENMLRQLLKTETVKTAVEEVAAQFKVKKKLVYSLALKLTNQN